MANTSQTAYLAVLEKFEFECLAAGRQKDDLTIICVSKGQPAEKIRILYEQFGQRHFGENRAEELDEKAALLSDLPDIKWHFIGRLQSRQIPTLCKHADYIHALDRIDHAQKIWELALSLSRTSLAVFISVNAEDEKQKSGVCWEDLNTFVHDLKLIVPHLRIAGLFSLPPQIYQDSEAQRDQNTGRLEVPKCYLRLAIAALTVGEGRVSLGMSGDMGLAIHAGSHYLRIGRAFFTPA